MFYVVGDALTPKTDPSISGAEYIDCDKLSIKDIYKYIQMFIIQGKV